MKCSDCLGDEYCEYCGGCRECLAKDLRGDWHCRGCYYCLDSGEVERCEECHYYCVDCCMCRQTTTVSGTITSFDDEDEEILIQLIPEGKETPLYEVTVKGNTAEYSITDVASGTYILRVKKVSHVVDEYTIAVGSEPLAQNIKMRLKGDVNLDDKVSAKDVSVIRGYVAGGQDIEIDVDIADITGDSVVESKDVVFVRRYVSGGWDVVL